MKNIIKNAIVYRAVLPSAPNLAEHLTELAHTPIGERDYSRTGFVPPPGSDQVGLLVSAGDCLVFALRYDEKIIPAASVQAALAERIKEIEADTGVKVGRKEKRELRDQVFDAMLPHGLFRTTVVSCFYHPGSGILAVATGSDKMADRALKALIKVVGSVETRTININDLKAGLTQRLTDHVSMGPGSFGPFNPAGDYWLQMDGAKVTILGETPDGLELKEALTSGMRVDAIRLSHADELTFKLTTDFKFKSLSFPGEIEPGENDVAADIWLAEAGAQFTLLRAAVTDLCELVGYREEAQS